MELTGTDKMLQSKNTVEMMVEFLVTLSGCFFLSWIIKNALRSKIHSFFYKTDEANFF